MPRLPKRKEWCLVPGPAELKLPCTSGELQDIALYTPEQVAEVILALPGVSLRNAAEPSWSNWSARRGWADHGISFSIHVFDDQPQYCSEIGLSSGPFCECRDIAEIWHELREKLPRLWLQDPRGWLYTPETFATCLSKRPARMWSYAVVEETQGLSAWAANRLCRRFFPELQRFTPLQRADALAEARRSANTWRRWVLCVAVGLMALVLMYCAFFWVNGFLGRFGLALDCAGPPSFWWELVSRFVLPPMFVTAVLLLVLLVWRRPIQIALREMLQNHSVPICIGCGYDLHGLTEPRCPECGREFDVRFLQPPQTQPVVPSAEESQHK